MAVIQVRELCTTCDGTGTNPGYPALGGSSPNAQTCGNCDGNGYRIWGSSTDLDDRLTAIEADIGTIKTQVQAIYDDLNP